MRRRGVIAGIGSMAAAFRPVLAQTKHNQKIPIIGYLSPALPPAQGGFFKNVWSPHMRAAGLIDGQTIRIEERWAGGDPGRLPTLAKELLALDPALVVAVPRSAIDAVRSASMTVPIIGLDLENDPVAMGYAASLSRPGSNVTGFFLDAPAICEKWLQQIKELVPNLHRLAVLWDSQTGPYQRDALLAAAKAFSVEPRVIEFRGGRPIDSVLEEGLTSDIQALVLLGSPLINQSGGKIAAVAERHRLPGIAPFRTFSAGGGLVSYGVDLVAFYRPVIPLVVKVLQGARPADIPIERPVKFELVVNLKTAKALGLTVPQSILVTADEVIE